MKLPDNVLAEISNLPAALRAVVEAELAIGNEIVEVLHYPVPPAGVGVRLMHPLSVPLTSATAGIQACRFPAWDGSCGYSDEARHNFVLGPGSAPSDPPDMGGGRNAAPNSLLVRFEQSLWIDHEKWREGIGYDLDAIREASLGERELIEDLLLERGLHDWRDVEALAVVNSPRAREALRSAVASRDYEVALAVARFAPDLLDEAERTAVIVRGLEGAKFFGGLSQALKLAVDWHPPPVIETLLQGALRRDGDVAVHFAAMLMFLHGQAETDFDWDKRPFFLTFKTRDKKERAAAFRKLCHKIGVEWRRSQPPKSSPTLQSED
jgi:hypothetical protein